MVKVVFNPKAKEEIKKAAVYYEKCNENLGKKFLFAVESTVERLTLNPFLYRKLRGRFMRCLIKNFPYGIIYSVDKNEIYIVAVMHLKRKPDYWLKHLKTN